MTTTVGIQTDHRIREHVIDELAWSPEVDESDIRVSVVDGVVILSGETRTFVELLRARNAVARVYGVSVIRNDLSVRGSQPSGPTDAESIDAVGVAGGSPQVAKVENQLTVES